MATLALFAGKINNMPGLIKDVRKSVEKYNKELSGLYQKTLKVDGSVCDLGEVMDSLRASSQTQEQRIEILENFQNNSEDFIQDTIRIDNNVADTVDQNKDDFYDKYDYLKPDCEKSIWEKIGDGLKAVGEWCKEHWKEILIVLELVVAVVCLLVPGLEGFGVLILENMLKGLLIGMLSGAIIGGISGYAQYGVDGILGGILQGAQEGAMLGMAFGGLGGVGSLAGKLFGCSSFMTGLFYGSSAISIGMLGFDGLALVYAFQNRLLQDTGIDLGLIDPTAGKFIFDLNQEAHSHEWYNTLQLIAGGTAAFSGGYVRSATCFVAGTLVLTANGLVAIENINTGDKVIATDPFSSKTEEKTVLDTFRRTTTELVHLTVNGECIRTTHTHPFYVKDKGFINAGQLITSDMLQDNRKCSLKIEKISFQSTEEPVNVYNLNVEEYHTYYIGLNNIFVHNACSSEQVRQNSRNGKEAQEARHKELLNDHPETQQEVTIKPIGDDGLPVDYNVRVDELTSDFFNEVKASDTAPYTNNQSRGYPLLERNGGIIRGKGKPGFPGGTPIGPLKGYTTRNGTTVPFSSDFNSIGGH